MTTLGLCSSHFVHRMFHTLTHVYYISHISCPLSPAWYHESFTHHSSKALPRTTILDTGLHICPDQLGYINMMDIIDPWGLKYCGWFIYIYCWLLQKRQIYALKYLPGMTSMFWNIQKYSQQLFVVSFFFLSACS